jgi:4-oxalomesaconate hydratase
MEITRRDFAVMAAAALATPAAQSNAAGAAPQAAPNVQGGNKPRVMSICAHPADTFSRAAGTLIKHVRAGCTVKVVWLSHGETEESQALYKQRPAISVEEVRRIRESEAFAAAKIVGAEGHMFGFGDSPIRMTQERIEMLAKEIADFKPDIILTQWKDETSYTSHLMTSQSTITAARMAQARSNIHFFEPNIGTAIRQGFVPDHYVDITDVFDQKIAVLKALPTQPNLVENYTACGRWRGLESGCTYAEAFVRYVPKAELNSLLD